MFATSQSAGVSWWDSAQRDDAVDASSSESDRYEELLVNPTLLLLARQRGEIDCGGLDYLIVAYGSFYQLVMPIEAGHISVCVEKDGDPLALAPRLAALISEARATVRQPCTP